MSDRQNAKDNPESTDSQNDETLKSYYYDDSTGYETYNAEDYLEEDEGEGETPPTEK